MLKTDKRCNVCKVILAGDDALLQRLYQSFHFRGKRGEPLINIAKAYSEHFDGQSLWRHLSKHQFIDAETARAHDIAVQDKTSATKVIKEAIGHTEVRELILKRGYKGIKSGTIKLKGSDVRAAAKDASDIEERQKDRSLQIMDMVMRVASGEVTSGLYDATDHRKAIGNIVDITD